MTYAPRVIEGDESILGGTLGLRLLYRGPRALRAALFADLPPDQNVLTCVRRALAHDFDLAYGFPAAHTIDIYRAAGYQLLGEMPRYLRVLRSRSYLPQRLSGWFAEPASTVIDRSFAAVAAVRALVAGTAYHLRWPADFDDQFDALWHEAGAAYPIACERSTEFLRARFRGEPHQRPPIVSLHELETGRLRAFTVLRMGSGGLVELLDLFGAGERELHALLGLLLPQLAVIGACAVAFRFLFSGNRTLPRLLASHGFLRRGDSRPLVVAAGRMPVFRLRDEEAPWYLTELDDDT